MAEIIENSFGRRTVKLSVDDIIDVVKEYQNLCCKCSNINEIRDKLSLCLFYLPEDI